MEGGPPIFRQDCTCPALLMDPGSGFPYGAVTRCGPPFQALPVPKTPATGLFRVRSPLLTESRLMSVPPATEMFQFAGFASRPYEFSAGYPKGRPRGWVAPFGHPGINDRSHLPRAFRSVPRPSSPLSAKASTRCPCLRSIPGPPASLSTRPADRSTPPRTTARPARRRVRDSPRPAPRAAPMKTLPGPPKRRAQRRGPGRSASVTSNSLFTPSINTRPGAPIGPPWGHPSSRRRTDKPASPNAPAAGLPGTAPLWLVAALAGGRFGWWPLWLVEVNGIEPMTSCLQSRRSPN